jgi:AAA domain
VQLAHGIDALDVEIGERFSLDDEGQVFRLLDQAEDRETDLIVVDTLRRATSLSEGSSESVALLGSRLRDLTSNGQRQVVVIHHLGKNGRVRGSSDLIAVVDSVVELNKLGDGIYLTVSHHDAPSARLWFRPEFRPDGAVSATEVLAHDLTGPAAAPTASAELYIAVLTALVAHGPLRQTPLFRDHVRASGVSFENGTEGDILTDMAARGLVTERQNVWCITDAGRQRLENPDGGTAP